MIAKRSLDEVHIGIPAKLRLGGKGLPSAAIDTGVVDAEIPCTIL